MALFSKYREEIIHVILTMLITLLICILADYAGQSRAVSSMEDKIIVPIVMYHHVKNSAPGKDSITPYEFESDLKYLTEQGYHTISMTQLVDYVYHDAELPPNPVILSFDDGYYNTYVNVFPLLKKYNAKIVLSIIGKSTDDFSRVEESNVNYSHATWAQIKEMYDSGLVDVQHHTYNMHKTKGGRYGCYQMPDESFDSYEQALFEDLIPMQEKIRDHLGHEVTTFTYPYGKFNNNTDAILKKIGFKATLSVTFGVNLIDKNPDSLYDLKRICRSHNNGIATLIKSGLETLKYSQH